MGANAWSERERTTKRDVCGHPEERCHPELPASKVILWEPMHSQRGRGPPRGTYVDTLRRDASLKYQLPR